MFDRSHPEWPAYEQRINERITQLQDQLESELDLDTTNRVRGAIGELRRLVREAAPTPVTETPRYS